MTSTVPGDVSAALVALAEPHLPAGDLAVEPLLGGMFATTCMIVHPDGARLVAKVAPGASDGLLTYEHDVLATEVRVDRLVSADPATRVPDVLAYVPDHPVLGAVALFEHVGGTPWAQVPTDADGRARVDAGLGVVMASLHAFGRGLCSSGPFGYPALPALQGPTWRAAFARIVGAVLDDAVRWGVDVEPARVRSALTAHLDALDAVVEPALVHTDLWEGNVLLDPASLAITGIVDTERAVVADPVLDVVGADQTWCRAVPDAMLDAYRARAAPQQAHALAGLAGLGPLESPGIGLTESGGPFPDVVRRFLLYRLYFALLMRVEPAPRGYAGAWVAPHVARLRAVQDCVLDLLEADTVRRARAGVAGR